jgi:hypothetical protein
MHASFSLSDRSTAVPANPVESKEGLDLARAVILRLENLVANHEN